jgi:hypothetical protein
MSISPGLFSFQDSTTDIGCDIPFHLVDADTNTGHIPMTPIELPLWVGFSFLVSLVEILALSFAGQSSHCSPTLNLSFEAILATRI